MGEVIQFRDDWQKSITTIAATGRVIELWEVTEGKRQAVIGRCEDGRFRWRAYIAVKHRSPRYRQKFRPICDVQTSPKLVDAKKAAKAYIVG